MWADRLAASCKFDCGYECTGCPPLSKSKLNKYSVFPLLRVCLVVESRNLTSSCVSAAGERDERCLRGARRGPLPGRETRPPAIMCLPETFMVCSCSLSEKVAPLQMTNAEGSKDGVGFQLESNAEGHVVALSAVAGGRRQRRSQQPLLCTSMPRK